MTDQTAASVLPPFLQLLQERPAGELYQLSSKNELTEAIKDCERPTVSSALYDPKSGSIIVNLGKTQVFCNLTDQQLLFACTCNSYLRGFCSHIATVWACLKRLVSPTSLQSIRFHPKNLSAVAQLIEQQVGSTQTHSNLLKRITERQNSAASQSSPNAPAFAIYEPYRLLLTEDDDGSLSGYFCRGNECLQNWGHHNLPPDIRAFLLNHQYFSDSSQYLQAFTKLRQGSLPIIFKDRQGKESGLAWQPDQPVRAMLRLELTENMVKMLPAMDNGQPLPADAIIGGSLLAVPSEGTLRPLQDKYIWDVCKKFFIEMYHEWDDYDAWEDEIDDEWEDDTDDDDEWYDDDSIKQQLNPFDPEDLPIEADWLHFGVGCDLARFNKAGLIVSASVITNPSDKLIFFYNEIPLNPENQTPRYRLMASDLTKTADTITLSPQLLCGEVNLPFSKQAFDFIGNRFYTGLSGMMRAKKRFKAILYLVFSTAAEPDSKERAKMIRAGLSGTEFAKLELRDKAYKFMNRFSSICDDRDLILTAHPEGWRYIRQDFAEQASLLQVLCDLYGHELFVDTPYPGSIQLPTQLFIKTISQLMERLNRLGVTLEFATAPVVSTQLEYTLDATNSSLDWFELKPEIRLEGELLSNEELHGLLNGKPLLQRGERLLLLDELSSQVLAMFSSVMGTKKGKRGKQELVRVPRLQILDWLQLRKYGVEVKLAARDAEVLDSLLNFEQIPKPSLPAGLVANLRHYQQDAWHWLAFLYQHRFGACLADDMGLGKTLQGISLLAGIMSGAIPTAAPPGSPHLVVAPPSLLFNWEAEIARFLPAAKTLLYAGTGRNIQNFNEYDIIITSYGIIQRDYTSLEKFAFDVIIFDETQVVKNMQAATTNAVRKLKGAFVLALTGTPVENHLGEYYAIMDLCLPGLLGSYDEFNKQINREGAPAIQRLIQRTRPFVLRRTKQMIASELPPKIESDIHLDLSPKQKILYQRTVEEVKGQVQDAYQNHAQAQARIIALTAILRLRQICLAPVLAMANTSDSSPKLEFLAEQLLELRDEGHSALVFSQFTGYLDLVEKEMKQQGLAYLRLDGSTPVPQRKKLVNKFQESTDPMVFLISLKAGGKGLNLTRATYVYHMDPWWNPAVENQASDRAHRIGQTGQVTITRLIMRHTIEEKMMALKARKLELYKALLEEGTGSGGSGLTREDFEFLLG